MSWSVVEVLVWMIHLGKHNRVRKPMGLLPPLTPCNSSSGLSEAGWHSGMGGRPIWEQNGFSFIQYYYQLSDNDRIQLATIYIDTSSLTWEGHQFQGKAAIVEKLSSLLFQKVQQSIMEQDCQPTPDSCTISMAVGQLKANEDPIVGCHQMFLLKNISNAWVCTNGQACPTQLQLASSQPGIQAAFCSLLFPILSTLLQSLQISDAPNKWAGLQWEWVQCATAPWVLCMMFGCYTSYLWQEKFVLYQHKVVSLSLSLSLECTDKLL